MTLALYKIADNPTRSPLPRLLKHPKQWLAPVVVPLVEGISITNTKSFTCAPLILFQATPSPARAVRVVRRGILDVTRVFLSAGTARSTRRDALTTTYQSRRLDQMVLLI
jgi:hypothetical protein